MTNEIWVFAFINNSICLNSETYIYIVFLGEEVIQCKTLSGYIYHSTTHRLYENYKYSKKNNCPLGQMFLPFSVPEGV